MSNLTVRTLHHYDEPGLLSSTERTPTGHRRYTGSDLRRLYPIRLLRQLGMSPDDIGGVPADPSEHALRHVLTAHVERLDDRMRRPDELRSRARDVLGQLDGPRSDVGRLLELRGRTGIFDDTLTRDRREPLNRQAERLTGDERGRLDAEWPRCCR